jgi:hypothetical protein
MCRVEGFLPLPCAGRRLAGARDPILCGIGWEGKTRPPDWVYVERGGPTPSHPEPGSETPQRRSYWRLTAGNVGPCTLPTQAPCSKHYAVLLYCARLCICQMLACS